MGSATIGAGSGRTYVGFSTTLCVFQRVVHNYEQSLISRGATEQERARMRTMRIIGTLGVMAVLSTALLSQNKGPAQNQAKVGQTLCPITNEKIDLNVYTDHGGKRVYFCCKDCVLKFKQDPAGIIRGVETKGIILDAAQMSCPVEGGKVDRTVYVDYGGRRIYFCCNGCIDKFNRDPQKYSKKMDQEAVAAKGM